MTTTTELWTPRGVRLRARTRAPGDRSWLFLPGGPGIGSESLHELVDSLELPGTSWLVDLPGDGSNVDAPGAPADPYSVWPHVLLEAAQALPRPVFVGHSTGGEYLLSVPELEPLLEGLVLVSTAPHAGWMPVFEERTRSEPLEAVTVAEQAHGLRPGNDTLRDIAVASAPWNFTPARLAVGRDLLGRMPYNLAAVEWSAARCDSTYACSWWPRELPTLIVSGAEDRIVVQHLWDDSRYQGPHVLRRQIPDAAHWPWLEDPRAVAAAFEEFVVRLDGHRGPTG